MSERCPHCHLAPSTGHFEGCPNWTPETHAETVPCVSCPRDELLEWAMSVSEGVRRQCECTFSQKTVGDGCSSCNWREWVERMVDQFIEDGP